MYSPIYTSVVSGIMEDEITILPTINEATTNKRKATQNPRRSEGELRTEMKNLGGVFLKFRPHQSASEDVKDIWETIERKGFLVTADTLCILPHPYYRAKNEGGPARYVAHRIILPFFTGHSTHNEDMSVENKNEFGWPMNLHYSHICHRSGCCNPFHIVVEEMWKNHRRNYCGHSGTCDCGMTPKCIRRYYPSGFDKTVIYISDLDVLTERLKELKYLGISVLPQDYYDEVDLKSANRNKRRKLLSE